VVPDKLLRSGKKVAFPGLILHKDKAISDIYTDDNLNTTQTPECSKGKYSVKIRK
jgi:hypothetical protein